MEERWNGPLPLRRPFIILQFCPRSLAAMHFGCRKKAAKGPKSNTKTFYCLQIQEWGFTSPDALLSWDLLLCGRFIGSASQEHWALSHVLSRAPMMKRQNMCF